MSGRARVRAIGVYHYYFVNFNQLELTEKLTASKKFTFEIEFETPTFAIFKNKNWFYGVLKIIKFKEN
jgi:hypothetical protein